jgi:hypothetical protein
MIENKTTGLPNLLQGSHSAALRPPAVVVASCGLAHDAITSETLYRRMVRWIGKDLEGRGRGPIEGTWEVLYVFRWIKKNWFCGTSVSICPKRLKKKTSRRIGSVPAEIRGEHLSSTSLEHYCCADPLGGAGGGGVGARSKNRVGSITNTHRIHDSSNTCIVDANPPFGVLADVSVLS